MPAKEIAICYGFDRRQNNIIRIFLSVKPDKIDKPAKRSLGHCFSSSRITGVKYCSQSCIYKPDSHYNLFQDSITNSQFNIHSLCCNIYIEIILLVPLIFSNL